MPPPKLQFDPLSDIDLDADNLLLQVERVSKTEDQICTSDIELGSPSKVRDMLKVASAKPPIDHVKTTTAQFDHEHAKPKQDDHLEADRLKIEVPLMPSPPDSAEKKSKHVEFKEIVEEYIDYPSQSQSTSSQIKKEEEDDKICTKHLEQYGDDMKRNILTEKFGINDKTLREDIPKLQLPDIDDPRTRSTASATVVDALKAVFIDKMPTNITEEKALNWVPIPQTLMRVDLNEQVEEKAVLDQYVRKPTKIFRSEQLLYTESVLRILHTDDDSDDELDYNADLESTGQPRAQPNQPARALKYSGDRPVSEATHSDVPDPSLRPVFSLEDLQRLQQKSATAAMTTKKRQHPMPDPDKLPEPVSKSKTRKLLTAPHQEDASIISGSFFSAGSLASFLDLRGGRFKKPDLPVLGHSTTKNAKSTDKIDELQADPIMTSQASSSPSTSFFQPLMRSGSLRNPDERVEVPSTPTGELKPAMKVPLPDHGKLDEQRTIIVDSALVSDRQLLHSVESCGGQDLTIIYRDLYGSPDMILSPTTCIIYTTMQSLTQKSLPGQELKGQHNTIQQGVRNLSATFDTVFVLVLDSLCLDTQGANSRVNVMSEFSSVCASIQAESSASKVSPVWVPANSCSETALKGGSPQFHWTWALIHKHAFRNGIKSVQGPMELVFLQDETLWELFLRKAGMNPMAAQVVTSLLKRPDMPSDSRESFGQGSAEVPSETSWGLRRFVSMSSEQRLKLFGDLVGVRAIEKINRTLGQSR